LNSKVINHNTNELQFNLFMSLEMYQHEVGSPCEQDLSLTTTSDKLDC